jgi:peroxiredoxin
MKQIFILAALLPLFSVAQNDNNSFSISGNIKGLADSTMVFLANPGESSEVYATTYSQGGKFTLSGKLSEANIYQLAFIGYKDNVELFMGADNVTITGDAKAIKKLAVKGSALQADYKLYQQRFDPIKTKLNDLAAKINAAQAGKKRDSMIVVFNGLKTKAVAELNRFIIEKPGSPVTTFLMFVINPLLGGPDELEEKYNSLLPAAKKGMYAAMIEKTINDARIGSIGSTAPDFVQNDTANIPVRLSSFRGKYVLIDFWASWCRPCRVENPNVVAAYQQFKAKNFTVLGVSLDQDKANWIKAIQDDNLTWPHVSDLQYWNNAVARQFQISSIPQNLLIDPSGKIIGKNLRGPELISKLQEIIK